MDPDALLAENQALRAANRVLTEKLEQLSLELAKIKRQVFGQKSERRRANGDEPQGSLFPPAEPDPVTEPVAPPPAAAPPVPHGRRAASAEPDEVVVSPAPDACPDCGGSLRTISTSTATRMDWRRGHFFTVNIQRPSCACDRCRTVHTAPEPTTFALPRSIVGNGLAAAIVVDKFADNIPLNRQSTRMEREGMDLSTSTLCDVVRNVGSLLARIVAAMKAEQLAGPVLQADDTGLPVLDGEAGRAVAGRLWTYVSDRHVVYDFTSGKHGTGPAAFLLGFHGILLADGGSEFNEAVRRQGLTRAGCWSHARRYFVDAHDTSPELADEALDRIGVLFEIERRIAGASRDERRRVRDLETRAAVDEVRRWLTARVHGVRPRSPLGQAIQYALNQWAFLTVCVEHPEIPIHNNQSELQLRRPVVGRKNWLFAGSEGGARTAATLFSLTGSCRLHGVDPWAYLHDVLGRINDHPVNRVAELSPAVWAGK